jgi:hypothetical protein
MDTHRRAVVALAYSAAKHYALGRWSQADTQ